ncbi:MAG: hypothetical protein WD623_02265 [Marinobacter sp.]|uniref:hypothetical protein n=1 Tax=Marinobacter sp. TaxID=50741 RepID=UPI0034A0AD0E
MSVKPLGAFANLSVRLKLFSGFGLLLVLLTLMALIAVAESQKLIAGSDRLTGVSRITDNFLSARLSEKNFFLLEDFQQGKEAIEVIDNSIGRAQTPWADTA